MISGELFECRLETEAGAIEVLAEVRVDDTSLERSQVFSELVLMGFETLLVTGTRVTGSRPGRRVRIRIDLLREVS